MLLLRPTIVESAMREPEPCVAVFPPCLPAASWPSDCSEMKSTRYQFSPVPTFLFCNRRGIIDSIACMEPLVFAIGRGAMDGFPADLKLVCTQCFRTRCCSGIAPEMMRPQHVLICCDERRALPGACH